MSKFSAPTIAKGAAVDLTKPANELLVEAVGKDNVDTEEKSLFTDLYNVNEPVTLDEFNANAPPTAEEEVVGEVIREEVTGEEAAVEEVIANLNPVVEVKTEDALDKFGQNIDQRERERVADLKTRMGVESFAQKEQYVKNVPLGAAVERGTQLSVVLNNQLNAKITADKRAKLLELESADAFISTNKEGKIIPPKTPLLKGSDTNTNITAIIYSPEVLGAGVIDTDMETNPNQYMTIDPDLGMIMSLSTEAFLHQSLVEAAPDNKSNLTDIDDIGTDDSLGGSVSTKRTDVELTKSKGNEQLGREIYKDYQRHKAKKQGQPTDSYVEDMGQITSATFTAIGDLAKESYARANPDMLYRDDREVLDIDKDKGQVYFQLTPLGADRLNQLNKFTNGLLAQVEVPPSLNPTVTGQLMYEGTTYTRDRTTVIGDLKNIDVILGAMKNYNSVAFINDINREKTANLIGILALVNNKNPANQAYSDMFGIGFKKLAELNNEKKRLQYMASKIMDPEEKKKALAVVETYNPAMILRDTQESFLNTMNGLAKYSGQKNYLTYYFQALTGRMAPQQTRYNPSANKTTRQVVGSGNIYSWQAGSNSEVELAWKEIMGGLLFDIKKDDGTTQYKGTDLSPNERIKLFNKKASEPNGDYATYVSWGKQLIDATNNFDNDTAKATFMAIANAKSIEEVNAAKKLLMEKFSVDPLESSLKKNLAQLKQGEAIHYADYYMDLAKYDAARKGNSSESRQFSSTITVELDGTTHGPSTNAILLGVITMAKRSGLIRDQDLTALELEDMRKAMKDYMLENVGSLADAYPKDKIAGYTQVVQLAVLDRENFLKQSPMTMGYGQELPSLKEHVRTTVFTGPQGEAIRQTAASMDASVDDVVDFLHSILVNSILEVLDPKVIAMGRLMKANALFSTITNEVLYFENASGFRSYSAGKQTDPSKTKAISYGFTEEDGTVSKSEVQIYARKAEGSATREGRGPGGYSSGRIQPVAVQSYDGNMVARTGTASSWDNITQATKKLGGTEAFTLPIMDAFVTDLGSFAQVRKEANKNWMNSLRDHSYVEKILIDWYKDASDNFNKAIAENPMAGINWADAKKGVGPFRGLAYQFEWSTFTLVPKTKLNLVNSFNKTLSARVKSPRETTDQYQDSINDASKKLVRGVLSEVKSKGIDINAKFIYAKDAKVLVEILVKYLKLAERNQAGAAIIKKDKAELMKLVNKEVLNIDL